MDYLLLFISAVLINNFVLTRFLGLCIFFGVSKRLNISLGIGLAVTFVMSASSVLAWLFWSLVLVPWGLQFLATIVFILIIASFVQLLEIFIRRYSPMLYNAWGIYLLLIATNCVVLGVPLINVEKGYDLISSIVHALGSGVGFTLAIALMASIREQSEIADIPQALRGLPIAFIIAGLLGLAFLGFQGMIKL